MTKKLQSSKIDSVCCPMCGKPMFRDVFDSQTEQMVLYRCKNIKCGMPANCFIPEDLINFVAYHVEQTKNANNKASKYFRENTILKQKLGILSGTIYRMGQGCEALLSIINDIKRDEEDAGNK